MESIELAAPLRITRERSVQQQWCKEFLTPLKHQFANSQNKKCAYSNCFRRKPKICCGCQERVMFLNAVKAVCCWQCHLKHVVQVWHITNSRQPKQIRQQTIVCLPNTTVNSDTNASVIELGVTHFECLLSRWKTNCRIQERNCSIIQQGQTYFQFRGNVYFYSSLTLLNTVISLITAVCDGERTYVIIIYV